MGVWVQLQTQTQHKRENGSYPDLWNAALCPLQDRRDDSGGAGAGVRVQGGGPLLRGEHESRAVAAYLASKYAKDDSLYPKDLETRYKVDQRLYFDMGVFYKAFGDLVYPVMFGGDKPGQDKVDKLKEVLGWVDGFVAEDKFCAGTSNLTIADIAFVATYSSLKAAAGVGGVDLSTYTNIESWFDKCIKLIPNYEKANGEGATAFGEIYKSK